MYVLKGFAANVQYWNNTPGQVEAIGELTTQSLTYSIEKGVYQNDSISPDIQLISFTSATDGTAQAVPNDLRDRVIAICKWVYDEINKGVQLYADQLLNDALTQFQTTAGTFACGNIISDGNGRWAPEWVSWVDNALTQAGTQNSIKFWFVDASFQSEFDQFSFKIAPPLTPLDNFFQTGQQVDAAINARTQPQLFDQITAVRGNDPETIQVALSYNYIDPNNPAHIVPTLWVVLVYGAAGNTIDSINDALVNYILANSTHSRDDWVKILPDLFRRTEFVLIPLWDQLAIPDNDLKPGLYATVTNLSRVNALFKAKIPSYPSAHIDSHLTLMAHPYKNLQIASVGSTDNRNNWYELNQVFADLLAVGSTSSDFGRMSQDTQGFLLKLEQMLVTAETMGPFTDIPRGFTRLTRDGMLYIVMNYENINYLVAAKQDLTQVIPPLGG